MASSFKYKNIKGSGLFLIVFLCVMTGLYIFKDQVKEHKVTKAKLKLFKRMFVSPPENWDDEFKNVFDSLVRDQRDTIPK